MSGGSTAAVFFGLWVNFWCTRILGQCYPNTSRTDIDAAQHYLSLFGSYDPESGIRSDLRNSDIRRRRLPHECLRPNRQPAKGVRSCDRQRGKSPDCDSAGSIYIADTGNAVIRKVTSGVIETVAGGGTGGEGPATKAQLRSVKAITVDGAGRIYLVDGNTIKMVSDGTIITIAGNLGNGFSGDNGPAVRAQLSAPAGVAVDAAGVIYIADYLNGRVRQIANGVITTFAGKSGGVFGGDGGPAANANLGWPSAVAVSASGDLYIADAYNQDVRKVSNGIITTVAGTGASGYNGDNIPASTAWLKTPSGVAVDTSGSFYIADTANFRIRKVAQGFITTIAGGGPVIILSSDGQALSAQLGRPQGIATDASGAVYFADPGSYLVMKVSGGTISAVAGNGKQGVGCDTGPATSLGFLFLANVANRPDRQYRRDCG